MGQPSHADLRHQRRILVANPAWVTEILAASWEVLEDTIPPAWRPRLDSVKVTSADRISAGVHEYGCGAYGCVFPTYDPSVVMKVSTDDTEAEFAANLAATLVRPICVRYHEVMALAQKHNRRQVYLLWRESADHVGQMERVLGGLAVDYLHAQHAAAQFAYAVVQGIVTRDWLAKHQGTWQAEANRSFGQVEYVDIHNIFEQLTDVTMGRVNDMMYKAIAIWLASVEGMAHQSQIPQLRRFAQGLLEVYEQQHIFFGDVHSQNVGLVARDDGGHWVITDPGHVVQF
jgi:hypothetical protein